MEELLENVTSQINTYESLSWNEGSKLSEILKDLTCNLFYLEKFRSEYQEQHNIVMHNFEGSVAAGRILADRKYPELYMLRRIMNAAYRCVDALRSNISYIKKEN